MIFNFKLILYFINFTISYIIKNHRKCKQKIILRKAVNQLIHNTLKNLHKMKKLNKMVSSDLLIKLDFKALDYIDSDTL